jgi:hypothetical protein
LDPPDELQLDTAERPRLDAHPSLDEAQKRLIRHAVNADERNSCKIGQLNERSGDSDGINAASASSSTRLG